MEIKPFNELNEFEQKIMELLMSANPNVEIAKMLFLAHLREELNEPDYLHQIEGVEKEFENVKPNAWHFERFKNRQKDFLKPIINLRLGFDYFVQDFLKLTDSYKMGRPLYFVDFWNFSEYINQYYSYFKNLQKYPFVAIKNNPFLMVIGFGLSYNNCIEVASIINEATLLYPNTYFKLKQWNVFDWLINKNNKTSFLALQKVPIINLLISFSDFWAFVYNMYSYFIHSRIMRNDRAFNLFTLKHGFEIRNFCFVIEMEENPSQAYIDKIENSMQKMAEDFNFNSRNLTYKIIV